MAVLSATTIMRYVNDGKIVISNFSEDQLGLFDNQSSSSTNTTGMNKEQLSGASYDVRLGEFYYRVNQNHDSLAYGYRNTYNPFSEDCIRNYFGLPRAAETISEQQKNEQKYLFDGIPDGSKVIFLEPGERILAHTEEFAGIKSTDGTTQMLAKSTTGRNGITVCKCAGWGDPGYINRWTLEIENSNPVTTLIVVGQRIAQIVFHSITPGLRYGYSEKGNYQSGDDIQELMKNWQPSDMLPRAIKL